MSDQARRMWSRCRLEDLVADGGLITDGDWVESKDQDPDGAVRLIQLADVGDGSFRDRSNRFLTEAKAVELRCTILRQGDVLIARMPDPLGRACLFPRISRPCVTVVDVAIVRLGDDGVSGKWLMHGINSPQVREVIAAQQSGSTRGRISKSKLLELELPVPPRGEQDRIADTVDDHFTRLDAAEAALKRAQARLKRFRASVLQAAVTGQLVPTEAELARREGRSYEPASKLLERVLAERRKRFEASGKRGKYVEPTAPDVATLPELAEGWCWATVDQLARVGTGATPKRGNPRYYRGGTIPWVTSRVARLARVVKADEFVTEAALAETNLALYPAGTLLVAMYGEGVTRGSCTELALAATTNQALAAVELCEGVGLDRAYLRLVFEGNYERLRRTASGGVQPNLNLALVKCMPVPLPPAVEQLQIVEAASALATHAGAVGSVLERSDSRLKRLRQATLTLAFEGRLVDPDPSDEPASALLDRIRVARAQADLNGFPKPRRAPRRPKTTK